MQKVKHQTLNHQKIILKNTKAKENEKLGT